MTAVNPVIQRSSLIVVLGICSPTYAADSQQSAVTPITNSIVLKSDDQFVSASANGRCTIVFGDHSVMSFDEADCGKLALSANLFVLADNTDKLRLAITRAGRFLRGVDHDAFRTAVRNSGKAIERGFVARATRGESVVCKVTTQTPGYYAVYLVVTEGQDLPATD